MTARRLGSITQPGSSTVYLWRIGPFWRRRYEVRCDKHGVVDQAPTSDIGWIRAGNHQVWDTIRREADGQ